MTNTLYYGDNLQVLRQHIKNESVDLIYLDPPFNSNRNYNVLFKDETGRDSQAQITAFEDTWHWDANTARVYEELVTEGPERVSSMIGALRQFVGANQMMAYLVMMAVRLVELHRVLKPTGSLYLHCDPTASHYLKIILDTIFGVQNFRNEIVWKRTSAHSSAIKYGAIHDILLFYSKTENFTWNPLLSPFDPEYVDTFFDSKDKDGFRYKRADLTGAGISRGESGKPWRGIDVTVKGRHWMYIPAKLDELDSKGKIHWPKKEGGMPRLKQYPEDLGGVPLQDVWTDVRPIHNLAGERLGYPTQKPLTLLERIVQASSNHGDIVMDPFCGCGTAIAAAQKLGRCWIGIDITHLSIALIKYRLQDAFPGIQFGVVGEPRDIGAARQLAQDDRFQFQWWALSLLKARPLGGDTGGKGKRGADKGIDGVINFIDEAKGKPKTIIVQVKSGKVSSRDIRDLVGTIGRENAAMGIFLTLENPSTPMITEAASAGFYTTAFTQQQFPRVQIVTVEDLLYGRARLETPPQSGTFKKAVKEGGESKEKQGKMF
jgi:site-specific DNA-methyltransferase (adenine-specific)